MTKLVVSEDTSDYFLVRAASVNNARPCFQDKHFCSSECAKSRQITYSISLGKSCLCVKCDIQLNDDMNDVTRFIWRFVIYFNDIENYRYITCMIGEAIKGMDMKLKESLRPYNHNLKSLNMIRHLDPQ